MNIIFLCGSIEPNQDGVGDYTRRIAAELIRCGNNICIISIMDKYIYEKKLTQTQYFEDVGIEVFRFSFKSGINYNYKEVQKIIKIKEPNWISLQYVPFAFNNKGLVFYFSNEINKIVHGTKFNIMFHELWVGMNKGASFKIKLWGFVQRIMIKSFIKKTKPDLIFTQTKVYQIQLNKIGFKSIHLPLFGNIPITDYKGLKEKQEYLNILIFGHIHPNTQYKLFLNELNNLASSLQKNIFIKFVGNCGSELTNWINEISKTNINFKQFGILSSKSVSRYILESDFAICTTPILVLEKSGTFTAIHEHGIPIICVSPSWEIKGMKKMPLDENVYEYIPNSLSKIVIGMEKAKPLNLAPKIANIFIEELSNVNH